MQRRPIGVGQQQVLRPRHHTGAQHNLLNINEWIVAGPRKWLLKRRIIHMKQILCATLGGGLHIDCIHMTGPMHNTRSN